MSWNVVELSSRHYGLFVVLVAFFVWRVVSETVASAAPLLHLVANKKHEWKFKNILVSLLHSSLTGIGGLMCFYLDPGETRDCLRAAYSIRLSINQSFQN